MPNVFIGLLEKEGWTSNWKSFIERDIDSCEIMERNNISNRKVFFLHPQAVVQDELVRALIADNFEAYLLRNHVSARMALRDYPDSILLVQVDSGLDEQKWIEYANDLKANPLFARLTICVLSVSGIDEIKRSYLNRSTNFSYGFTYGGYDFSVIYPLIKEMLEDEKTNPPRISIKGGAPEKLKASVVFTRDGNRYEGWLREISISGLTCKIEGKEPLYPSEIPIPAIIITYNQTQFTVSGRIAGNHGNDDSIHLILFDNTALVDKKNDICDLIHACLQAQIETLIKEKSRKERLVTRIPRSHLYRK